MLFNCVIVAKIAHQWLLIDRYHFWLTVANMLKSRKPLLKKHIWPKNIFQYFISKQKKV